MDVITLIENDPTIHQLLASLVSSSSKDLGVKISTSIIESLTTRFRKKSGFSEERIVQLEKKLNTLLQTSGTSLMSNYWTQFMGIMFPERAVGINELDSSLINYISQRIYAGLTFQSWLFEIGYNAPRTNYMVTLNGRSQAPYYFDVKSVFEQHYVDNFAFVRVVHNAVEMPTGYVMGLPTEIDDINSTNPIAPTISGHDFLILIRIGESHHAQLETLYQTIRNVQERSRDLPRIICIDEKEIDQLSQLPLDQRSKQINEKFDSARLYRGR